MLKSIILARGGSKGVIGKNIRKINGVPLLAYPIIQAQKSKHISEIYVSTDDDDIKKVAIQYGASIINRPKELCQDNSLDVDAMKHAVEYLNDKNDIVHLRATTPMIVSDTLDKGIEYFLTNTNCTSLRSCHQSPETAYKSFQKHDKYWRGLFDDKLTGEYYNLPRQNLPKTYHPNGYIDIVRPKQFMYNDSFHGSHMLAFETEFAYEVDTENDFKILQAIYGNH